MTRIWQISEYNDNLRLYALQTDSEVIFLCVSDHRYIKRTVSLKIRIEQLRSNFSDIKFDPKPTLSDQKIKVDIKRKPKIIDPIKNINLFKRFYLPRN